MLQLPDLLFLGGLLLEMTNKEIANIYTDPQNDPNRVAERPIETIDGREGGGGGGTNGSFIGNIVTSVVNFFSNLFGGGDEEGEEIDDDIVSERILPINDKMQKEGDYCFVACIEALLEYNGFNNGTIPSQEDIASKDRTGNSGTDIQGIKAIMYAFGFSTSWDIFDNTFNFDDIRNSIDNGVPMITSIKAEFNHYGLLNHAIIVKGYTLYNDGTFNIYTMNPAGNSTTYKNLDNFIWTNSNSTKNSFIIYIRKIK